MSRSSHRILPRVGTDLQSRKGFDQFCWHVSSACDAEISQCELQRNVIYALRSSPRRNGESRTLNPRSRWRGFSTRRSTSRPTISRASRQHLFPSSVSDDDEPSALRYFSEIARLQPVVSNYHYRLSLLRSAEEEKTRHFMRVKTAVVRRGQQAWGGRAHSSSTRCCGQRQSSMTAFG